MLTGFGDPRKGGRDPWGKGEAKSKKKKPQMMNLDDPSRDRNTPKQVTRPGVRGREKTEMRARAKKEAQAWKSKICDMGENYLRPWGKKRASNPQS